MDVYQPVDTDTRDKNNYLFSSDLLHRDKTHQTEISNQFEDSQQNA